MFYLFGIVPTRFSYGVKAVANELDVKLPGKHSQHTDEGIATACVNALKASTSGAV